MTEVTVDVDCTSAKDTTLDLRVNSRDKLVPVVSNIDVCINTSEMTETAQVDPS